MLTIVVDRQLLTFRKWWWTYRTIFTWIYWIMENVIFKFCIFAKVLCSRLQQTDTYTHTYIHTYTHTHTHTHTHTYTHTHTHTHTYTHTHTHTHTRAHSHTLTHTHTHTYIHRARAVSISLWYLARGSSWASVVNRCDEWRGHLIRQHKMSFYKFLCS